MEANCVAVKFCDSWCTVIPSLLVDRTGVNANSLSGLDSLSQDLLLSLIIMNYYY